MATKYIMSDYVNATGAKCIGHRQYQARITYGRFCPCNEYIVVANEQLADIRIEDHPDFGPYASMTLYARDGRVVVCNQTVPYDPVSRQKMDNNYREYARTNFEHNGALVSRCFRALGRAERIYELNDGYVFDDNAPERNAVVRIRVNTVDTDLSRIAYRDEHKMEIYIPNPTETDILATLARHACTRVVSRLRFQKADSQR